jgi:hypothetical protein
LRSLGLDIIPLVVCVGTREGLAARDGGVAVEREDLLHALVVVRVDNGADIEVGCTSKAVEADLTQHAWDVVLALGDRVPVADPALGEGLVGGLIARDGEGRNAGEAEVLGEVDGAFGAILVDEVH